MKAELFKQITDWQKETFPNANAISKIHHLKEEVTELLTDLENDSPNRAKEYADCIMLLYGSAHADGMSFEDICNAIENKFIINKNRKWGKPDENGVVKHLTTNKEKDNA